MYQLTEKNCVVYDVEIQREVHTVPNGWDNPGAMGMASAVTYDFATDQYDFFLGDAGHRQLLRKLHTRTVVGFNSVKFDSRVILGNARHIEDGCNSIITFASDEVDLRVTGKPINFDNIDLALFYIKARFLDPNKGTLLEALRAMDEANIHDGTWTLDALCSATLNQSKSGHGALAPKLWQENKFDKLFAYNLHDVRLTRNLFLHILAHGTLRDGAGRLYTIH